MGKNRFKIFDNKPFGLRAGGIVIHDNKILLIRRVKPHITYYAIPGGGVDPGETVHHAIAREIMEETNQTVTVDHILYHLDYIDDSDQYFGLCTYVGGGEVKLTGEEAQTHCEENQYHPEWVPLSDLANLSILPVIIRDWLVADLPAIQNGSKPFRHEHGPFVRQSA